MSDYPRIHPRETVVREAAQKLRSHLLTVVQESDLTEGEQLRVISEVYSDWVASMAKYMIRHERHGNENKPGGLV
jgi:hypothetical protein